MSHLLMLNMYCKLQMELNNVFALLFTIVYCSEPQATILGYSVPKNHSKNLMSWTGVASGILVTTWSLAALITQATATALLSCRNASCGFRIVAGPAD